MEQLQNLLIRWQNDWKNTKSKNKTERTTLLTAREKDICKLLALGHTNLEIAEKLSISQRTVETHRTNIMTKLGLKSRAELVKFAMDHGLLNLT